MIDPTDLLISWLAPILGGLATAWVLSTFTSLPNWTIPILTLPGLFAGQAAMLPFLTLLTRLPRKPRPTNRLPATNPTATPRPQSEDLKP